MHIKKYILTILVAVFAFAKVYTQERKEIDITSDVSRIDEEKYPGAFIMNKSTKQVHIVHEGIEMWCDLAFHYKEENFVKALGKYHCFLIV